MCTFTHITLLLTVTMAGLMAGLFYAWSCSINLGLIRLNDETYLTAMQHTNRAIQNPVFFVAFFGVLILLPLSAWQQYGLSSPRFLILLVATVVYFAGSFGVTVFGNIPLNEALDAFDLRSATTEAMAIQRRAFEGPWNNLNTIRTLASVLTLVLTAIACLYPQEGYRQAIV